MVRCCSSSGPRDLPHAQGVRFSHLVIRLLGRSDLQPEVVAWVWNVFCCFFFVAFWSTCGGYVLNYPRGEASVLGIGGCAARLAEGLSTKEKAGTLGVCKPLHQF